MHARLYLFTIFTITTIRLSEGDKINPLKNPYICGRPVCEEGDNKFKYNVFSTYRYDYKMIVKTEFVGSGQNSSEMHVLAGIEVGFPSLCGGILKINTVELRERALPVVDYYDEDREEPEEIDLHPRNDELGEELRKHVLRFSFHDGTIDEVCPEEEEVAWALNLKKGILSTLQNTMQRFDVDYNTTETDVSGTCDVSYMLMGTTDTSLLIQKHKDITSCTSRYKTNSILQTTPYNFRQNYAAWPVLKSDSFCNISVDHYVYNNVSCYENHLLIPFSNNRTGASTESRITLTLADEETGDKTSFEDDMTPIVKRSSLLFDHSPTQHTPHGEIKNSRELLKQMCKIGFPDIQRDFPDIFVKFLQNTRLLSHTALQQLLSRAASICGSGKNHVLETLPYIGSTASVLLMRDQIVKQAIPKDVAYDWMSAISFTPRPDADMMQAMYTLVEYGNTKNELEFTLGATAVAHTFCRQNPDCEDNKHIQRMVKFLVYEVMTNIRNNTNSRIMTNKVMVSLKGLGNIGVVDQQLQKNLLSIVLDENVLLELRLQSILVFRKTDCFKTRDFFLDVYRNFTEQSEIRIMSYLQAMHCPDYISIKMIKHVLETEEVNQVGSYVWSHLNNLAKSASPVRIEAQGLLIDGDLSDKYKLDIRRFSRNYEYSLFFDEYNFGTTTDANLIFGTDSFMPRMATLNFTADLFGESINLFEFNVRMQGFEHYLESLFGPMGAFSGKKVEERFNDVLQPLKNLIPDSDEEVGNDMDGGQSEDDLEDEDFDYNSRIKRDSEIQRTPRVLQADLKRGVEKLKYKLKNNYNHPILEMGMKMFGNDLKYRTVDDYKEMKQFFDQLNPKNHLIELLSGRELTYTKSGVFLDISYAVPLSSGLPLSVSALGASSIDLRMSGLLKMGDQNDHFDVEGKIKPSISVDIIATMKADLFYADSGIKVKTNMYSSSSVEAKLRVRGAKLVSLQLSLPQEKNEIFSAKSEILVQKEGEEISQPGVKTRYENSTCTWPVIDSAVGLKICTDYSLPDVSNKQETYPSLILSGPLNLSVYLNKADPTAKMFSFEYRWDETKTETQGSFIFETPDSAIPRKFSATLNRVNEDFTLSMGFQNGNNVHAAEAVYKVGKNEKRLDCSLNINGQKQLALEMGYNRTALKYGWTYLPKVILSVNNDRIAGLAGTLKFNHKKNISQIDINLVFETKKLQSKLEGYVTITEASWSTKLRTNYRFLDTKNESIEVEAELANRSQKLRTEYHGLLKIKSSAYPKFNFASDCKLINGIGHVEGLVNFNNAPDFQNPLYNLAIKGMLAKTLNNSETRTMTSLEITRPLSKIDFKLTLRLEEKHKKGPEHNFFGSLKYATNKEITTSLSIWFPQGHLYAVDTAFNLTVPAFDSCSARLKIYEKQRNDYDLFFSGAWFSGHSITIKGLYHDRSSTIKTYRDFKLVVQSPSFDEASVYIRYSNDAQEFKFKTLVNYAQQPYAVTLKYSEFAPNEKVSYAELRWQEKSYWVKANLTSQQTKQLLVDMHIDKIRDIHVIIGGFSTELRKEIRIEVKWDANRDPSQKLIVSADFNTPGVRLYDGGFLISYPDRSFNGHFDISLLGPRYKANTRLSWSPTEAIEVRFEGGSNPGVAKDLWLRSLFVTPFDGWKYNAMSGGFYYINNLMLLNSSITWAESQNLGLELMGDYDIRDINFSCEMRIGLNSTIKDVPTVSGHLKHSHDGKKFDTDVMVRHKAEAEPEQMIAVRSNWHLESTPSHRNISGSVVLRSPFVGYTRGALVTKFSLNTNRQLLGAADLDLEEKRFKLTVEGHIKKLTENMLTVNVTTPIEKFRNIVGRFGINEHEKHIVAEVRAPNGSLGFEVLFLINSNSDFDIKFFLATPLDAFEKLMLVAKMNNDMVDFRGGWNKVMLGFIGVWRMESLIDFEYSYRIFTPLENFEENGLVARLIKKSYLDIELSVKFSKHKLGLIISGQPKSNLLQQLQLQRTSDLLKEFGQEPSEETDEEQEEDDEDNDFINFSGHMELDTLIWQTIRGDIEVEEFDDFYLAFATLQLPQGTVEIRDKFTFPDYLVIMNDLKITTPFGEVKEITSKFESIMDMGVQYKIGANFAYLNSVRWVETSVHVNYIKMVDEAEMRKHDVTVKLKTPLIELPKIRLQAIVELDENTYRGQFMAKTATTNLTLGGSLESEPYFIDSSLNIKLISAIVPYYSCKAFFKKDFSKGDNSLEIGYEQSDNVTSNDLRIQSTWSRDKTHFLKAKTVINTNIIPLISVEGAILLTRTPNPTASLEILYKDAEGVADEIRAKASRLEKIFNLELNLPLADFRNMTMYGTLSETSKRNAYAVRGTLYSNKQIYHIEGTTLIVADVPEEINLVYRPSTGGESGTMTYTLQTPEGGYGRTWKAKLERGGRYGQIGGGLAIKNKMNWDFAFALSSSEPEIGNINIKSNMLPGDDGTVNGILEISTPWKKYEIDNVKVETELKMLGNSGFMSSSYELPKVQGKLGCLWSWQLSENMQVALESSTVKVGHEPKSMKAALRYLNPNKNMQRLTIGGDLDIDSLWILSGNGSIMLASNSDIGAIASLQLPQPVGDKHKLSGRYRGNLGGPDPNMDLNYEISYESEETRRRYASRGQFRNVTDVQGLLRFEWGPDIRTEALEGNVQMLRKGTKKEFAARIATPYYLEDTVAASGSYDTKDIYHVLQGILNVPASNRVADGDVAFSSLSNMKGKVNCTTPFLEVLWLKGDFDFSTHGGDTIRYVKATWPNNSAVFDSKSQFTSHNLDRDQQGVIKIEVPLQTRHIASIVYGLKERPQIVTGHAAVEYNKKNILNGQYTCKSETKAGLDKDVVDITLDNEYKPIGIHFVHQYEHSSGPFDSNFDFKRAEVFELHKSVQYNITGELHIKTTVTGQQYKIVAIHPNRTVIWTSDYDYQNVTTIQRSKLELSPTVWIGYNFKLRNMTTDTKEEQVFTMEVTYPKRNISTDGWYSVTDKMFDSDISFKWTQSEPKSGFDSDEEEKAPEEKVMRAALKWVDEAEHGIGMAKQKTLISLRHPSFERDITFEGQYHRNPLDLFYTKVIIEYAEDPMHLLEFGAVLKDLTNQVGYRNYTLSLFGGHEASELELEGQGSVAVRSKLYSGWNRGKYKRGYLPLQEGSVVSYLDLESREVYYNRTTPHKAYRFWYKFDGQYPLYQINGTFEDSPDVDSVGTFYVDIEDKVIKLQVNLTEDASQNIHMYGIVPDARSASFDLWRDYEDIRVVDVAYFLRMNHSRLVTSHLLWRPNLKNEFKDQARSVATGVYNSISETIDFWIKTLYTESMDTASDVWHQAKPYSEKFLDDVGGLKVISDDVEELRKFLNESYHADDFYIRSVVNFTMTVLDELAVKNHITSLPKIIREIGQVMGESGQALRKSVLWLVETIKQSYKKALDILGQILHGETLEHITGVMEKAVEKYDKFIKDLHVSFIKYVEKLYTSVKQMIASYWQRMLLNIEPSLIKLIHYVEMLGWNIGKEVFDFLYKRTNEIIESPYFNQVSNFTQDLDRLYRDLIKNDTITNIKKYSVLAWQFIKQKYFKIVPFGNELNSLVTELWEEIKTLQNLESVQFVIQRYQEVQAKIEWLADEFQVERRIAELWEVVRNKMSRFAQTALQADNRYREAKTKFIFDPDKGVMELQQKLPMSWHAFNETPKFEEIPEYKLLIDIQNFFSGTNFSVWNWYKKVLPYQNPSRWFPPYEAKSILIGSRHYMTFDKRYISLNLKYQTIDASRKPDQCSYLLSNDFLDGNFTLILEPSIIRKADELIATRKLSLLAENELIDVDYVANIIRIGRNSTTALPAHIGNTTIYRQADILYIESEHGFLLECNLMFDLCTFDVSGWYFGKTAGILGTMNNEIYDDRMTATNQFASTPSQFVNSWSLPLPECKQEITDADFEYVKKNVDLKLANLCSTYFNNPLSYFEPCFSVVDPQPFYDMCLDLGVNQGHNFLPDGHPAEMGACTVALSYMEACSMESIALRVPDTCVYCRLQNGSYVGEGTFLELQGNSIPKSTDVVFIIEAKPCNEDVINEKSLITLVSSLHKELLEKKIVDNRYAVLAFGGPVPFDKPRNIIVNNQIFADYNNLAAYFSHIHTGPGNSNDIFRAIITATKMTFRPGASKTFILLPCSKCSSAEMKFDYSAVMQLMLENGIKLHILMDQPFTFDKDRISKMFFGMDRNHAYSKKDLRELTGDVELWKQVRVPKPQLGVCTSLALELNGTIFSARKLMPDNKNPIKKFSTVFAKRVARTAHPSDCQTCECTGHNTGEAFMQCYQCDRYVSPMSIEEGFDEDLMAHKIQGGETFESDEED